MDKIEKVESISQINSVAELAKKIWQEHYTPIIGPEQVSYMVDKYQSAPAITEQMVNGYQYFLVVEQGEYAGYFSIRFDPDQLFLSKYYIDSAFRGRGLGRVAMDYIEMTARNHHLKSIYLTVNKHNSNSIAIYKKLGFEIIESLVSDIGNGFVMDDYKLQKLVQ